MKLTGDYHTHTTYTHGKSTVEENVSWAEKIGLKEIAITEHSYLGYNHIQQGDLEKMRKEVIETRQNHSKINVLFGIEANLMSRNGDIDISDEELSTLDLVVLGFHKQSKYSFKEWIKFALPNRLLKKKSKKQIEINTMAYIKAMDKHRVSILAHLKYGGCDVDCVRLANECVKRGIYIELNGKRINFTDDEIKEMIPTGVQFIIDSDAHIYSNVGKNDEAFNIVERCKIPENQIANIDGKMPKFN